MRKSLASIFFGFIFIAALVSNAQAQMCGCMGEKDGGMQAGAMMGGMGHQDMGMMHGMGGMQGCAMIMGDDNPMWKHLMSLGLDDKQKDALKALRSKTMKDMLKKMADKQIAGIELKDLLDKDPHLGSEEACPCGLVLETGGTAAVFIAVVVGKARGDIAGLRDLLAVELSGATG